MRKECIISILIIGVLLISGCTKIVPPSPDSDEYMLQRAGVVRRKFVFSGKCEPECECNEECMGVVSTYEDVISKAKNPQIKAEAQQTLSEFFFQLRRYNQGLEVARELMETAPNDEYRCTGMILVAQNLRGMENYEAAFNYFNNAQNFCGSDRQQFLKDNMCYLYEKSGQMDKAKALCPEKYS